MTMNMTRRALLGFGGGAAVGIALSPAPWKLIDDLGIWTQNWKWIPRPPQGPVTVRNTTCSLCPAGCGVQARCIGGHPVAMRAASSDPVGAGALCALGQTGHHLRYHPARLTSSVRVTRDGAQPVATASIVSETARALKSTGTVAVLDMRPGRSVSWAWRRLMAELPDGVVIDAPGREGASLATLHGMLDGDAPAVGVDLEHARAILSFGAPLAEGWGSPHLTAKLLRRQKGEVHLIQVDPTRTPTADTADRWLAAKPGTEGVVALGIARVLLTEGLATADAVKTATDLAAYTALVERFTPAFVESVTGVPSAALIAAARELAANLPAVVIAGEDAGGGRFGSATEAAIFGLNALLTVPGTEGGVIARTELPAPFADETLAAVRELSDIRDGSISLLLIDSTAGESPVPWPAISRKLARGARVVALTPYLAGTALHADYAVASAPFLEATQEVATPFDATRPMLGIAAPVGAPRAESADAVEFVRNAFASASIAAPEGWTKSEDLLRARVAAVHGTATGEVITPADGTVTAIADVASPDDLWTTLTEGGRWQGSPTTASHRWTLVGQHGAALEKLATPRHDDHLTLLVRAPRDVAAAPALSPVVAKIYQESALRRPAGTAALNPRTARQLGLRAGRLARLQTAAGKADVLIATDESVMPGVAELTVRPLPAALGDDRRNGGDVLDICTADANGVWRSGPAKLVEA